ncbi:MAG: tripartite tricarboxylate transporter substrate binding protein [Burkholderiales bacterium]|nr:tripartite tricarboxylate transporter substrate binding protein [Burkholderiales bacterium]
MKRATMIAFGATLLLGAPGFAQDYPQRAIRMVIPYPPGGNIDTVARRILNEWIGTFGQQIVIDNRGGAGGTIGTKIVAKASANGYTILYGNIGPLAIGPHVYQNLDYDVFKDFAPVTLATVSPFMLFVSTKIPVNSVKELIAYAKERPGKLNYASSGVASGLHLTSELFARVAQIELVHVPYKGIGAALPAIASGQIHLLTYPPSGAAPHVKSGLLKPLMVAGDKRSPHFPDAPTAAELGMPRFDSISWHAILAPAGTPPAAIRKLQQTFKAAIAPPQLQKAMAEIDVELVGSTPAELEKFLRSENEKWGGLIRSAGIRLEQ